MKKTKLVVALMLIFAYATSTAGELGLNMETMNMYAPTAKGKSKSSGGKAFEGKGSKTLSIGLGMSSYLGAFGKGGFYRYGGRGYYYGAFWYSGTLPIQLEFGVHDYVGVGLVTGIGGRSYHSFGGGGVMYIPFGVVANFHFMQLIGDKKGVAIADKLDVYAGLNVGTGLAVSFPTGTGSVGGMLFAGPQIGLKYFFNEKIGVYTEFGYGKSLIEGGVSIKL